MIEVVHDILTNSHKSPVPQVSSCLSPLCLCFYCILSLANPTPLPMLMPCPESISFPISTSSYLFCYRHTSGISTNVIHYNHSFICLFLKLGSELFEEEDCLLLLLLLLIFNPVPSLLSTVWNVGHTQNCVLNYRNVEADHPHSIIQGWSIKPHRFVVPFSLILVRVPYGWHSSGTECFSLQ